MKKHCVTNAFARQVRARKEKHIQTHVIKRRRRLQTYLKLTKKKKKQNAERETKRKKKRDRYKETKKKIEEIPSDTYKSKQSNIM